MTTQFDMLSVICKSGMMNKKEIWIYKNETGDME
jgi:hypothetical protein